MKKVCTLIFICFCLISFAGGPKEKYTVVRGKVTDVKNNESLAGVKVSVKGQTLSTYTDFDGNFILSVPASSACMLEFEMLSYEPSVTSLQSQSGNELNISLKERQ